MQYHFKATAVNAAAVTTAVPRVVDTHSLLTVRASKAVKACDAADAVDGLTKLQNPTIRLAATAYGVSTTYVGHALQLTPKQRQAVRRGERPLILPRAPSTPQASPALPALRVPTIAPATAPTSPATSPTSPVTMGDAHERLREIVSEIGLDATLNLLAATEKVAA